MVARVDTTRFRWSGKCRACSGPSNRYDFRVCGLTKPTRSTLVLRGRVRDVNGRVLEFPARGERVEVCYRCKRRWERNGGFETKARGAPPPVLEKAAAMLAAGCSVAETARALRRPQRTVADWVAKGLVTSTPRTTKSSPSASSAPQS